MISRAESRISLVHTLVRIMYIMLNEMHGVLMLIKYNNINVLYHSLAFPALLSGNVN